MGQCSSAADFELSPPQDRTIQKIASAIGVPVEAFSSRHENMVFHLEPNGSRWLLEKDPAGRLVVRGSLAGTEDSGQAHENVSEFLARNAGTPQGDALATLIDRTLSMCLGFAHGS